MTDNKFSLERFLNGEKVITGSGREVEEISINIKVKTISVKFFGDEYTYPYKKDGYPSCIPEDYSHERLLIMATSKKKIYFCLFKPRNSSYIEVSHLHRSKEKMLLDFSEAKATIIKIFEEEIEE